MFSSKSFIILALPLRYLISFELIFVYGEVRVQIHYFACEWIIPAPLVEQTILSSSGDLGTLVENQLAIDVWV